jgi:hypothetical protein
MLRRGTISILSIAATLLSANLTQALFVSPSFTTKFFKIPTTTTMEATTTRNLQIPKPSPDYSLRMPQQEPSPPRKLSIFTINRSLFLAYFVIGNGLVPRL